MFTNNQSELPRTIKRNFMRYLGLLEHNHKKTLQGKNRVIKRVLIADFDD